MYKKNLTKDGRFESAGKEVCGKALKMASNFHFLGLYVYPLINKPKYSKPSGI